jgi:hypothetical protein
MLSWGVEMGDQHKGDTDIRGQSRKQLSEGLESTRRRTDTHNWKAAYRGVRIIRRTAGAPPPLGGRITLCRSHSPIGSFRTALTRCRSCSHASPKCLTQTGYNWNYASGATNETRNF